MSGAHTRLTLFDQPFDYPVLLAPVAHQALFHPEAELATARGASAMRAGQIVSMQASTPFEAIAEQSAVAPWCQVYPLRDESFMADLLARVERAGYRAIVVTADATVNGLRNHEQRSGFVWPSHLKAANLPGGGLPQPDLPAPPSSPLFSGFLHEAPTWPTLQRLMRATRLPVLLKGVLSIDDAQRAVAEGVSGLIVSNHGGRVLDTVPASLDALPRIVDGIGDRVPVLLDGGIRRGTDVLEGNRARCAGGAHRSALRTWPRGCRCARRRACPCPASRRAGSRDDLDRMQYVDAHQQVRVVERRPRR